MSTRTKNETNDEYAPLAQSDDEVPRASAQHTIEPWALKLFTLACIAAALCSLLNVALALVDFAAPHAPHARLPRPDPYIGLAAVRRNASTIPPLRTFPELTAQAGRNTPHTPSAQDPGRWLSSQGTVSPDEMRIQLTPDVVTLAQFRVHDYAMQRCAVVAALPADPVGALAKTHKRLKDFALTGDTSRVRVWSLAADTEDELDARSLTWAARPPRARILGTLHVAENHTSTTPDFPCARGSLITVEFECLGEGCNIDFYQDQKFPVVSFHMRQTYAPTVAET